MLYIDQDKVEFSFKNALAFAEASDLAYKSKEEAERVVKTEWGFTEFYPINKKGTQGFIAKKSDLILISFRGTEQKQLEDILTDVIVCQKKTKLGYIHSGFLAAVKFVWKDTLRTLKKFQDNNQPIWITGHSLGGALAILTYAKLSSKNKFPNIKGVYTYGSPRVGDDEFKELFQKSFFTAYRVTNYKDPVSIIPFSFKLKIHKFMLAMHYKQSGKMLLFTESGEIAKREDACTRAALVGVTILGILVALISKLVKKIKSSDEAIKWMNDLIAPHDLLRYKGNIIKNMAMDTKNGVELL